MAKIGQGRHGVALSVSFYLGENPGPRTAHSELVRTARCPVPQSRAATSCPVLAWLARQTVCTIVPNWPRGIQTTTGIRGVVRIHRRRLVRPHVGYRVRIESVLDGEHLRIRRIADLRERHDREDVEKRIKGSSQRSMTRDIDLSQRWNSRIELDEHIKERGPQWNGERSLNHRPTSSA